MKRLIIVSLIALLPAISACHTVQGVGKDVSAVGHGVTDAAKQ